MWKKAVTGEKSQLVTPVQRKQLCVISDFRRGVDKILLSWGVTKRTLVVIDVSEPIGPIFKGQLGDRLSRNVDN